MKAVYRYGYEPRQYEFRDMPDPTCGPEDVSIEVKYAAICGSDVATYFNGGEKGGICIVGHEFAGTVVQVGSQVSDWKPGDRVVSDNTGHVCGKCHACTSGLFLNCMERVALGYGMDGGFAKYVKIPGEILRIHKWALMRIPDGVPYEYAAILDPICNAYKAVAQESGLRPGESAIVFGPGPIGLLATQFCHIMGAKDVIMVGLSADKALRLDVAYEMGVTEFIASDAEDFVSRIHEVCGVEGADVAIDCAGAPSVLLQAISGVRKDGTIVKVGASTAPLNFSLNDLTYRAQIVKGHHAYDVISWRNCLGLLSKNMLRLDPLITHILPLEQWERGIHMMRNREGIKILLQP